MIERCYFKFSVGAVPSCPNRLSTTPGGVGSQATPRTRCVDVRALRDAEEDRDGWEEEGRMTVDPPRTRFAPFVRRDSRGGITHPSRGWIRNALHSRVTGEPVDSAWPSKIVGHPLPRSKKKIPRASSSYGELTRVYSTNPNCATRELGWKLSLLRRLMDRLWMVSKYLILD